MQWVIGELHMVEIPQKPKPLTHPCEMYQDLSVKSSCVDVSPNYTYSDEMQVEGLLACTESIGPGVCQSL